MSKTPQEIYAQAKNQTTLAIELARAGNQIGHDGHLDGQLVQVKYHGGSSTTVSCGDPDAYDVLIIVLGPDSVIRPADSDDHPYLFLVIPSDVVKQNPLNSDGTRTYTAAQLPLKYLDLDDEDR